MNNFYLGFSGAAATMPILLAGDGVKRDARRNRENSFSVGISSVRGLG